MKQYKVGVIGLGYIGNVHVENLARLGIEIVAIADNKKKDLLKNLANKYKVKEVFENYKDLINFPEVEVIHNCTPNKEHFKINKYALEKGKHVISEKPLATNSKEGQKLLKLANENNLVTGVNFNYRYYPVIQHMKEMISRGEIGNINIIMGYFLQDWLFYETDYNWRIEKENGGPSRAIADIGSHWCDLAMYVSGLKIKELVSDLNVFHTTRKKPKEQIDTFSRDISSDFETVGVSTEDYGAVIIRFDNGTRGIFSVSQVSAGRKCKILMEVYGNKSSVAWDHERANELWIGHREKANEILLKDPALLYERGKKFSHYPGGHPEGYPSAIKNFFIDFYEYLSTYKGKINSKIIKFPTFQDGYDQVVITDAILKSNNERKWVEIIS